MGSAELLEALAHFDDDAQVTITVRVRDARRALGRGQRGPDSLSTVQAAELIGGSARKWREWAAAGLIEGAKQDEGGSWRLPNTAAREHYAKILSGELRPGKLQPSSNPKPRGRRGGRKKAALAAIRGGQP